MKTTRKCCVCKKEKPLSDFHRSDYHPSGYVYRCKPCAIAVAGQWYRDNKDKKRAYDAKRRAEKPHLYRAASKRWQKNHPAKKLADTARRRASKALRTPVWADLDAIDFFYECCPAGCHVDHIIPLRGKHVSGLHIETNLQWLPALDNIAKGNRYGEIA